MLRKYLKGSKPSPERLANMANYRNVSIEWLATGKGPKSRTEQRAAQSQTQYLVGGDPAPLPRIDLPLLRQCLGACNIVHGALFAAASVALQLEYAADFYNALLPNIGPRASLQDMANRDARSLADTLRGLIALGTARPFSPPVQPLTDQPTNKDQASYSW